MPRRSTETKRSRSLADGSDGGRKQKSGSSGLNVHDGGLRRRTALAGGRKVQLHSGHGRLDQHVIGENAASGGFFCGSALCETARRIMWENKNNSVAW